MCEHCNAFFWYQERVVSLSSYAQKRIVYHSCCRGGRISLPKHRPFPPPLCDLIRFNGGLAANSFMKLIRHYNSMFAFTSLGVDIDRSINTGRGPYIFRINGVVHHRIGSLIPDEGNRPQYAQLYIYDTANEVQNRLAIHSSDANSDSMACPQVVESLISMFDQCNPLVKEFRMARDRLLSPTSPDVRIRLFGSSDTSADRYSLPAVNELAALIVGDISSSTHPFDIVLESCKGKFRRVPPIHPALIALQYPILFPYGDKGYQLGIRFRDGCLGCQGSRNEVSMMEFYSYYQHYRRREPNPVLCSGRLSQQYGVNAYSCVEANRLSFHFFNQKNLRSETYQGISDALCKGASTGKDVGIKTMLPASYPGSRRNLNQNYHDCMAISRAYGSPTLFTTFTCNANWPEIAEALRCEPGQKPPDRADITSRVFHMKLQEYIDDIRSGDAYGPVTACENFPYLRFSHSSFVGVISVLLMFFSFCCSRRYYRVPKKRASSCSHSYLAKQLRW